MKTNLQNKWRLPTKEEFEKVLYPNKDKIPNLEKDSYYWSSSEVYKYVSYYAWYFSFGFGKAGNDSKYSTRQVRAVRDVSPNSTNLSNSTIIGNLEVYNQDLDKMNWRKALAAINKLNKNNKSKNK
jgi:hypothetical protein